MQAAAEQQLAEGQKAAWFYVDYKVEEENDDLD
jgi:hypothetical protein